MLKIILIVSVLFLSRQLVVVWLIIMFKTAVMAETIIVVAYVTGSLSLLYKVWPNLVKGNPNSWRGVLI